VWILKKVFGLRNNGGVLVGFGYWCPDEGSVVRNELTDTVEPVKREQFCKIVV
jgi:hypothetical protein